MAVYFIQESGDERFLKIGYSDDDVRSRLAQIQTGNPRPLELLGILPDATRVDEAALHFQFAEHWVRGEWFTPSDEIIEFVELNAIIPEWAVAQPELADEPAISAKKLELLLNEGGWLGLVTYDFFKYAKAGGELAAIYTPDGLTITLPDVTLSSEGINKRFGKMIAAAQEAS